MYRGLVTHLYRRCFSIMKISSAHVHSQAVAWREFGGEWLKVESGCVRWCYSPFAVFKSSSMIPPWDFDKSIPGRNHFVLSIVVTHHVDHWWFIEVLSLLNAWRMTCPWWSGLLANCSGGDHPNAELWCSGRGQCISSVCVCESGFSGSSCELRGAFSSDTIQVHRLDFLLPKSLSWTLVQPNWARGGLGLMVYFLVRKPSAIESLLLIVRRGFAQTDGRRILHIYVPPRFWQLLVNFGRLWIGSLLALLGLTQFLVWISGRLSIFLFDPKGSMRSTVMINNN